MDFLSYDGFVFADLNMWAGIEADRFRGRWQIDARYVGRVGAPGHLGPGEVSPTTLELTIGFYGANVNNDDLILTFDRLVGRLNPLDQSPRRKLVALRPDGSVVWRYASVSLPHGVDPSRSLNSVIVRFTSADPLWRKEDPRVVLPSTPLAQVPGTHSAVSLPNSGQAAVHPVYRADWNGVQRAIGSGTETLGVRFRRTITFTNNRPNTVPPWPYWIPLGDTDAITADGKARNDGNDLRVLYQGKEIARQLVAWGRAVSYAMVLLPRMEAGQTIELDVVYGNSVAGAPKTFAYPNIPAIQTDSYTGLALAGGTTTQLNATEAAALSNAVALGGTLVGVNGANAGVSRTIQGFLTSGGVTTVFTDTFPSTWSTSDRFLVMSSRNGRLLWNTAVTERGNNPSRGRWYASSGESSPDTVDFRVPCSWGLELYQPGRDKKGQRRYSRLSVGGDLDTFTIVDVSRTWENGPSVPEEGGADGVKLSLPFPITAYRSQYKRTNPSGMCKALIACRGKGGEQYRELASISTPAATETTWDPGTLTCPTDTLHLYSGLIPAYGDEIPPDWRSDQGSTTSGGSPSVLSDNKKEWIDGQWVGATLTMTDGANKRISRPVTASTPQTVTVSPAFPHDITDDKGYELRHKPLLATLRDFLECNVDVDLSGLEVSALGTEESVYDMRGRMWGGGGYGASPARRGEVRIGTPDDKVLIKASETIELDSATRTAVIRHASGAVVRRLVEPTVQWVATVTEDGITSERRSLDGMPLPIGTNPLENAGAEVDLSTVTLETNGGVVAVESRVTGPTPFQYPGAFRLAVNTNPGGSSAWAQLVWPAVACRAGDLIELVAALRTNAIAVVPRLGVRWLDQVGAPISSSFQASYTPAGNTWMSLGEDFTAPDGAYGFEPIVRADPGGSTSLAWIYVDAIDPGSPALWYDEHASAGIRIGATYHEGFLA